MAESGLSNEALIIQHRSAFSVYLKKGIEAVKKFYPESLDFVSQNQGKTLAEVTAILSEKLKHSAGTYSEILIPDSVR